MKTMFKTVLVLAVSLLHSCSDTTREEPEAGAAPEPRAQRVAADTPAQPATEATPEAQIDYGDDAYVGDGDVRKNDSTYFRLREQLPDIDFDQDISGKSLAELRILRNLIPARKGYVFMKSDLRSHFENTPWYRTIMEARWYGDCEYSKHVKLPPITYSDDEKAFMERVSRREKELLERNYTKRNGKTIASFDNVVNGWLFSGFNQAIEDKLRSSCLAIVPNENVQFFHVYEKNDYAQIQSFVTTDMYLQLFHIHFSFLLRKLEERFFLPTLEELTAGMYGAALRLARETDRADVREAAEFTATSFAIPLSIIRDTPVEVPDRYEQAYRDELDNIAAQSRNFSSIIPAFKQVYFQYSLFKPRGHYTRTEELKKYFRAMQWLQLSPLCLKEDPQLRKAALAAHILNTESSEQGTPLRDLYQRVLEPVTFLIGEPDNLSVLDVCTALTRAGTGSASELFDETTLGPLREDLAGTAAVRNRIKPKVQVTCPDKINFMPARFVMDNEILQDMAHIDPDKPSKRPFPKGLDVFAALGSGPALDLLLSYHEEARNWDGFMPAMNRLKRQFQSFGNWDTCVYNKWIQGLMHLLKVEKEHPYFMHLDSWDKKSLNTALASWAELKHDAILYAEQPFAAECGSGEACAPPPEPYTVGYVEPNTAFWQHAIELLDLTAGVLDRNKLLTKELRHRSDELKELTQFLLNVSRKELRKESLSPQEYRTIEIIGSTVENLTLSIMETDNWHQVKGPDREVAVVADIYTNNVDKSKAGVLHVAVGHVNDLYVVVEIEGYLYITKGATFSYYEFPQPLDRRLTDEQWQQMLKRDEAPPVPGWLEDIMVPLGENPHPKVRPYHYSSGC